VKQNKSDNPQSGFTFTFNTHSSDKCEAASNHVNGAEYFFRRW